MIEALCDPEEIICDPEGIDQFGVKFCIDCGCAFQFISSLQVRCQKHQEIFNSRDRHKTRPLKPVKQFMTIDCEGGGQDERGRQNLRLIRASTADGKAYRLFKDNKPLTTVECLEFILGLPANVILQGFWFDYDVAQILKDLPRERLTRLLHPKPMGTRFTDWGSFRLDYLPSQFLMVARGEYDPETGRPRTVDGSVRRIDDAKGLFEGGLVKVLRDYKVVDDQTANFMDAMKRERNNFTVVTPDIEHYCDLEIRKFSEVLTIFRDRCTKYELAPKRYRGAGYIAERLLIKHAFPKRIIKNKDKVSITQYKPFPKELDTMMNEAYFGGRMENSATGFIDRPVYFYDLNGAYPASYKDLPCPTCTEWRRVSKPSRGAIYIANLTFMHPFPITWCGFPFRDKKGYITFPLEGSGSYWCWDIEAAKALGAKIKLHEVWQAERCCDHNYFGQWVDDLYNYRVQLGKDAQGMPIKLALNAIYGKFMQHIGEAKPYQSIMLGGLVTSKIRWQLAKATAINPASVLMMATDGIYSVTQLDLPIGNGLGSWKVKEFPNLFVVEPGFYWSPKVRDDLLKTKGISSSHIDPEMFEMVWRHTIYNHRDTDKLSSWQVPEIPVKVRIFTGIKLGLIDPNRVIGSWIEESYHKGFDWSAKRHSEAVRLGMFVGHYPLKGDRRERSRVYDPNLMSEIARMALNYHAMPDHYYIPIPGVE